MKISKDDIVFAIEMLSGLTIAVVMMFSQNQEAVNTEQDAVFTASPIFTTMHQESETATPNFETHNYSNIVTATPGVSPDASQTQTETATSTATATCTPTIEPTATPEPYKHSNGEWFIAFATSYTDSGNETPMGCKNGIPLVSGWSVASFLDDILPYGTIIEIENMGVFCVCDTCNEGGAVWNQRQYDITKGKFSRAETWIDIYFDDEEDANDFGRALVKIRILKYGDGRTYTNKY